VNGVDRLLVHATTREVVLPYLNDRERLLVLSQAVSDGTFTGQFAEFVADIAGWFRQRGVERVTFVGGSDDEDGGDAPQLPRDPTPDLKGRLTPEWSETRPDQGPHTVKKGAHLRVRDDVMRLADWVFIPHAHAPPVALVDAFQAQILAKFPGKDVHEIVSNVWNENGRAALRDCYEAIWSSDHNLVSMCLYAGPFHHLSQWSSDVRVPGRGWVLPGSASGMISTGDAKLSRHKRRNMFQRVFGAVLDKTAVIIVPHHGAESNWHPDILSGMNALRVGCATAGLNGYGHPHQIVAQSIFSVGAQFLQVSDDPSTMIVVEGTI
jgi:hypothetical protein